MPPTKRNENVSSFLAPPVTTAAPPYSCCDVLGAMEAIKAQGNCLSAVATFIDDATSGEIRWLAQMLQERIEAPQMLSEAAEGMIRREFAGMGLGDFPGKGTSTPAPVATNGDATPDWLKSTPEVTYSLTMFGPDDSAEQELPLQRDEFIALKAELGRIRGLAGVK